MHLPRSRAGQALLLLFVAFATRIALVGDPVIHGDEQFYLLVGDRLLHGAWPYVDIFDRKPVGLFLVFAGIRAVGGDGVIAYQIAAMLVAAATAFVVGRIVSRVAGQDAGVGGGMLYLVWLVVFDGAGGQSPVWGNALMAVAALLVLDALRGHRRITARGTAAMLLVGGAMQIKYTALFEGIFFGLALLRASHRAGRSWPRIVGDGALWIAAALLPTALAWGVYAAAGHNAEFVFANFVSIFGQRDNDSFASNMLKLAGDIGLSLPLAILAWCGRRKGGFALAWVAVAAVAIVVIHTFELFYLLPLTLPLSVAAGVGLERTLRKAGHPRIDGRRLAAALLFGSMAAILLTELRVQRRGDAAAIARLVEMVGESPPNCLFTYGSEPILYFLTRSCLPTPYVFRSHLGQVTEVNGIGVDPTAETARLLAARPGVIVIGTAKSSTNLATQALVLRALRERYRLVGTVQVGKRPQSVYRLRPGA